MGIDPAPFWANFFLYFLESIYVQSLISSGTMRFDKFNNSYKNIYSPQLELKVEHERCRATFLDLNITLVDGKFVSYFIVRIPNIESNIPLSIFYGSVLLKYWRIAGCTLLPHIHEKKIYIVMQIFNIYIFLCPIS